EANGELFARYSFAWLWFSSDRALACHSFPRQDGFPKRRGGHISGQTIIPLRFCSATLFHTGPLPANLKAGGNIDFPPACSTCLRPLANRQFQTFRLKLWLGR